MRYPLFLIFLFCLTASIGQEDYQFMGVLRIGEDAFISYQLDFSEDDGLITGYSVTDQGGDHETKSYIAGTFDDKEDTFEFYESGILYTKSPITQDDFCFVHFEGKLRRLNERQDIEGLFKGLYSDGEKCIDGELKLLNFGKILKRAKKIDRKVDNSVFIAKEKKDQVNLVRDIDSLKVNRFNKNETLSVFTKSSTVVLRVSDAGQEDGDRIELRLNGNLIYSEKAVTTAAFDVQVPLEGDQSEVEVKALSTGTIGANTVLLEILDGESILKTVTNLQKEETARFVFYKKAP